MLLYITNKEQEKKSILFWKNYGRMQENQKEIYRIRDKINSEKYYNRIGKRLKKENAKNVILSKECEKIEKLKNALYSNNIDILNGRFLFENLLYEILKYIEKVGKKEIEKMEISIMINNKNENQIKSILFLAEHVKMLNIITNHIENFKPLEEYLYNKLGIIIRVTNNTKKSLMKSDVVFNIDFPEELLNKYRFRLNGILINVKGKIKIISKKFNGININYYNTNLANEEEYDKNIIFESKIYQMDFSTIRRKIKECKVEIIGLIGNNGIVNKKEFENSLNILDKSKIVS